VKVSFNYTNSGEVATRQYLDFFTRSDLIQAQNYAYDELDVVLFMSYDSELTLLEEAKAKNKNILIGVVDPRAGKLETMLDCVDFLIVDSFEMEDFWRYAGKPIFRYSEYFIPDDVFRSYSANKTIQIGYHGNKVHILSMVPRITNALKLLSREHQIKLKLIYNVEKLGRIKSGLPNDFEIEYVQWSESAMNNDLANCDIAIVPNSIPLSKPRGSLSPSPTLFLEDPDDYVLKFKYLTNPSRIITCGMMGIPVVADIFPSSLAVIDHGINGYLAHNTGAWHHCLEELIVNLKRREEMGKALKLKCEKLFHHKVQNNILLTCLEGFQPLTQFDQTIPKKYPYTLNYLLSLKIEATKIRAKRIVYLIARAAGLKD